MNVVDAARPARADLTQFKAACAELAAGLESGHVFKLLDESALCLIQNALAGRGIDEFVSLGAVRTGDTGELVIDVGPGESFLRVITAIWTLQGERNVSHG